MAKHLLLTGVTGQVGQYLIRDLLLAGQTLTVLVRPRGSETPQARIDAILRRWESELGTTLPRPACVAGDITEPGLGLNREDREWVAQHCDAIVHNAASLTFIGSDRNQEPWLSNLTGTGHVIAFCRDVGLRRMHYVSTAFVCGKRSGLVREDELDCGQEFRNDYEHCKCEAEKLIRAADCFDELTVYRPAMIVGDSRTGYTATYHGLYPYLQFAHLMTQFLERDETGKCCLPLRLNLTGDERRNLVPIDWVSAAMTHLLTHPEFHGQTYHLTPYEAVTARVLEEAMSIHLGFYGPSFVGPDGFDESPPTDLESQFYEYVATYQPYWNEEPEFDTTNIRAAAPHLPCPPVDVPMLRRLMEFAIEDRWGKGSEKRRSSKA